MIMDQFLSGFYGSGNELLEFRDETLSALINQNPDSGFRSSYKFVDQNCASTLPMPPSPVSSNLTPDLSINPNGDSPEDCDFSDAVLKYINQIVMEEDMEEKTSMYHESAALHAAEQSFHELLGEAHSSCCLCDPAPYAVQNHENPDEIHPSDASYYSTTSSSTGSIRDNALREYESLHVASQSTSQSFHALSNGNGCIVDGFVDSPVSILRVPEFYNETESVMQFKRGFEEASRFLPSGNSLIVDFENNALLLEGVKAEATDMAVKVDKKNEYSSDGSRRKKNPHHEDVNLEEGRSNKQSAVYIESKASSEMFDMVLTNCGKGESSSLGATLRIVTIKNAQQNGPAKGSSGGKSRGKRQGGKKGVVDLGTLLTLCAQAVSANDTKAGNELLKQIRQHSSPMGDAMQRLAHYFSNGLEARMAGSGTAIYRDFITKSSSAAELLKAYGLYLTACPFKKLSNYFCNTTIMNVAEKATRLHIIDFGIRYGFQWSCLIQRLSSRPGGPPKLRITGIDLPQPGFRPAEFVEETGRRLANCAETHRVPFEFNAIAQRWDTIQIEDLKIDRDEVLVVNSLHRLRRLLDETVVVESPRDNVLNLIRKMNPDVFTVGIVNGAYSAPFFLTRFREALFHFSTLFDMLEVNVPRETPERVLIESEIFGRQAMNVIACEGSERIERPETYKQWQVRNLRAGFTQLPLNKEIAKVAKERVRSGYHKDFVIHEDSQWLLLGWKGRIAYALSSWRAAY